MNEIIWNDEQSKFIMIPSGKVEGYKYYLIQIKSCDFYGENDFCISFETIEKILNKNINKLNVGDTMLLDDFDSDSYIKFTILDTLGKVTVNGEIGGSHRKNSMRFEFIVDQTILQNLINLLNLY